MQSELSGFLQVPPDTSPEVIDIELFGDIS